MATPERNSPAPGGERRAVVLDVDGTLVDSNLAHARAWHVVLAEAGIDDVVHVALRRAGVPPERALMLGDTPYDVEAAERAGVECVAVGAGGWDVPDLDGVVAVYDDPAAILAGWAGSPFAAWSEGVSGEAPAA